MKAPSVRDHLRSTLIVIPAKAGIHPAVDTGFRRYDKKEKQGRRTFRSGH